MKKDPDNQFTGGGTPSGPPGTRQEKGDAESSRRDPPYVPRYERGTPVQSDTEAPDAVPVLPANASGRDKQSEAEQREPIDDASMYDRRPSQDKHTPPSEAGGA